ncbi:MAG: DUF4956 domain-containing protein [Oscillospiraceae bacterium]|nr:DUF4956 domain-containing protein [Oscillospiraceae bacterium]
MSIIDAIKNSVLEGFNTSLTPASIFLGLLTALLASLFILLVYRRTMQQVTFNRSYCMTLMLVTSISAMMVLTITSNLALSLGMVGALSIVRFRTAVKDSADTAFLFWAVAAGITSGAGFYLLTFIGCLFIGAVCVVFSLVLGKVGKPFLLVLRTESSEATAQAEKLLRSAHVGFSISSALENDSYCETVYNLSVTPEIRKTVSKLRGVEGVSSVSLVDCRNS